MDRRHSNGPAPARTDDQRRDALVKANRIRKARSHLKRRVKFDPSYRLLVAALNNDTAALGLEPDELATMKVYELLLAAPRLGRVKANRLLTRATASLAKTIGGLTDRQREELILELELWRRQTAAERRDGENYNRMLEEAVAA